MAYYLKLPPDSGSGSNNKTLVQISGMTARLDNVSYTLAETIAAPDGGVYIYDHRRQFDSVSQGSGTRVLLLESNGSLVSTGTTNWQRNGQAISAFDMFSGSVDDVMSFDDTGNATPSNGTIALFARFNEVQSFFNLAVKQVAVTVGGIVHTFDMSSSNGTLNEFTSDTGQLTFKLFNAPSDGSQWVFYDDGGAVESAVAASWPLFQAQVNQDSTAPDITSDIAAQWPLFGVNVSQGAQAPDVDSTIAAAWPLFSVQANQDSELPQYQATIATDWPMFSAAVSQQSEVPQYNSDVAASWPLFNVSAEQSSDTPIIEITAAATWPLFEVAANQESQLPEGATSVAVTWPLFGVNANQQSTEPEFDSDIAAAWPLFQVSASQQQELPSGAISVAVEWPLFSAQASQGSTIPEFTATVAAEWPLFTVSVLAGEFDFSVAPSAIMDIPKLSRIVDIPSLSRTIDI